MSALASSLHELQFLFPPHLSSLFLYLYPLFFFLYFLSFTFFLSSFLFYSSMLLSCVYLRIFPPFLKNHPHFLVWLGVQTFLSPVLSLFSCRIQFFSFFTGEVFLEGVFFCFLLFESSNTRVGYSTGIIFFFLFRLCENFVWNLSFFFFFGRGSFF